MRCIHTDLTGNLRASRQHSTYSFSHFSYHEENVMGNCASSDAERSFAEQQRRRAANIVPGQPTSHGQQVDGYGRPMVQIPLSSPGPPGPPPQQRSPNAQNFPAAGPSPAPQPEPQNINTIRGDTKIGRKSGEVLVISYDLGTTGCKV